MPCGFRQTGGAIKGGEPICLNGNSMALQPLSISGQQGLNATGGIGAVTLKCAQ